MLFIKKRPDLPKRPGPSETGSTGLFVEREPAKGPHAEILDAEDRARPGGVRMRAQADVTDVLEVVEVVERVAPESPPTPSVPAPEDDTHADVPAEEVRTSSGAGLRLTRKARPAAPAQAPDASDAPDAPQAAAAAPRAGLADLASRFKKRPAPSEAPVVAPASGMKKFLSRLGSAPKSTGAEPAEGKGTGAVRPAQTLLSRLSRTTVPKREGNPDAAPSATPENPAPPKAAGRLGGLLARAQAAATARKTSAIKSAGVAPEQDAGSEEIDETTSVSDMPQAGPGPAKPSTAAKTSSKKKKPLRASGPHLDLLIELDAERRVFWRVTRTGLTQVSADDVRQAASFSPRDYRYGTEEPLSYNQARDLALSEIGEECRIVNASKSHSAVYATTAARVSTVNLPFGPGLALIERLLAEGKHEGRELVVGLLLTDEASTQSLALLYHVNLKGVFSAPQVTMNPDNLNFTISQFASSKRLDVDAAEVLLFKNAELLGAAGGLELYPAEAVWNGISVRKLAWMGVFASMAAAGLGGTYGAQAFVRKSLLQSEQTALAVEVKAIDRTLQTTISESLVSFAATQSVDVQQVSDRAAQLWVPHSKVTLEATSKQQRYDISMPLTRGGFTNNRPSVLGQLATRDVEPLIGMTVPEGCTKDIPGVSGGVDAIQITINCESSARPVNRYRLD